MMGTEYRVGCKTCGIFRDIDKYMYNLNVTPKNREDAMEYAKCVKESSFRNALLLSFLIDHASHDCIIYSEHEEEYDEDGNVTVEGVPMEEEGIEFWTKVGERPEIDFDVLNK